MVRKKAEASKMLQSYNYEREQTSRLTLRSRQEDRNIPKVILKHQNAAGKIKSPERSKSKKTNMPRATSRMPVGPNQPGPTYNYKRSMSKNVQVEQYLFPFVSHITVHPCMPLTRFPPHEKLYARNYAGMVRKGFFKWLFFISSYASLPAYKQPVVIMKMI